MPSRRSDTRAGWIVGPGWDAVVCFSTIWFPVALWAVFEASDRLGLDPSETSVIAFTVLLNLPHFLTTVTATYLDREERRHYAGHPFAYYVVPALLLVLPWLYCAQVGPLLFVTLWTLFGEHHVAAQNLGFTALYRSRNGEGEEDRRVDHRVFHAAWMTTVFAYGARPADGTGLQFLSRPAYTLPLDHYDLYLGVLGTFAVFALVAFLARQVTRHRRGLPVSLPKVLFVLTAWPSFILVPLFVNDAGLLMVLRSGYHAVQYWALARLLNRRRAGVPAARGAALTWLIERSAVTYWALHVVPALAIWWISEVYSTWPGAGSDWSLRYLFFPGAALAHFFVDGLVWRASDPHARRTVFDLIAPAGRGQEARRAAA